MRYALHSFYFFLPFLWYLYSVPSANNKQKQTTTKIVGIIIIDRQRLIYFLVLNQLIIHVFQAGIFITGNIANEFFAMYIEYKMPLIVLC